jgi:lipopolysaccharide export system permease protein
MRLIERYLFRQLAWPTLAAIAALGGVALITQTLSALDLVVDQHQNALVFGKIVLLTLPSMAPIVAPIALFVAALWALNRLHGDQELVVCFSGGMSRWRVTAAAWRLAAITAVTILAINLFVMPAASREMRAELFRVRTDLAASLVHDGEFSQPSPGLTVYAQSVDAQGRLKNVFIHQQTPPTHAAAETPKPAADAPAESHENASTFTAKRGLITRRDGKPVLILMNGSNQSFNERGALNFLAFDEYVFDLTPYLNTTEMLHYKISDRFLHELIFPDLTQPWEKQNRKKMQAEAHARLSSPLYAFTFMALALQAVLGGAFSRTGYGRRIAVAGAQAAGIRIVGFAIQAACDGAPALNVLQYVVPLAPLAWVCWRFYGGYRQRERSVRRLEITPLGPTSTPAQTMAKG